MSEAWVRKQVFRKALPHFKIGKSVRFSVASLDEYLKAREVTPRRGGCESS